MWAKHKIGRRCWPPLLTLLTSVATWGLLWPGGARAGAPDGWEPGVEGQAGAGPVVWSPDEAFVAATSWDRAGLLVVPLDGGPPVTVSDARGAGFHPVWVGGGLLFKEVVEVGDGRAEHRIVWFDPATADKVILDSGPRLGDPSVSRDALVAWSRGDTVTVRQARARGRWSVVSRWELPGYSNLVQLDPAGSRVAFNRADGAMGLLALTSGRTRWLTGPGAYSHPAFSPDGQLLLLRGPGQRFTIFDVASGKALFEVAGSHPAWLPDRRAVVFDRVSTEPYRVLESDLWVLWVDENSIDRLTGTARHERYPVPAPSGTVVAFVDTITGDLFIAPWDQAGALGPPMAIVEAQNVPWPKRPRPSPNPVVVDVPYMHQLWDTPDDFDGGWSCGPTSCVQTIQKYQKLPDHDITCTWPYSHTSHWGWYIPNEYTFAGYTYDILGLAKGDVWVPGAHGFICRELGAAYWAYMVDFNNQHELTSWQAGPAFSTLTEEVDDGYPMVASTTVLGYGHIIVMRGYDVDHSIVVNDPYGDAGGTWGQYDGEAAVYDWPGYNTGHLEIGVNQLFGAQGPIIDPVPEWDAAWVDQDYPATMVAGQSAPAWIEYRNEGTQSWDTTNTRLGTTEPRDRSSAFHEPDSWIGDNRPTAVDAATAPEQTGRFSFELLAPDVDEETAYTECWGLVQESETWFGPADDQVCFEILVMPFDAVDPPIADAGPDQRVALGSTATLDGSGSEDPDGMIVDWTWQTPDGTLDGRRVQWTPTQTGTFEVRLTVTDDLALTDTDSATISVYTAGAGDDADSNGCDCAQQGRTNLLGPWWIAVALAALGAAARRRRAKSQQLVAQAMAFSKMR